MSITAPRRTYTAEELERFPSDARFELIEGELREMAPAGEEHGTYNIDISSEVNVFIRRHGLGRGYGAETGFIISRNPDTVLAPDYAFTVKERVKPLRGGFSLTVPDLVLETRSPGDTATEVADKVRRWLAAGVRVVWELNLRKRVLTVHRPGQEPQELGPDDTLTADDILPGFSLPLSEIFRDDEENQ